MPPVRRAASMRKSCAKSVPGWSWTAADMSTQRPSYPVAGVSPRDELVYPPAGMDDADSAPDSSSPFEGVAPEERAKLIARHGRRFAAGDAIFQQGAPALE